MLDGLLWRGATGVAGEIGPIPVDPAGPLCPCGQRGCLETVASGSAVARLWPGDHASPVRALFAAAASGDGRATAVRDRLVANIAASVRIVVLTVDVELVVIGGGLSALGDELLASVRGVLRGWEQDSPFLGAQRLPDRIVLAPHGANVVAVGAALVGKGAVRRGRGGRLVRRPARRARPSRTRPPTGWSPAPSTSAACP